MLCRGSYLTQDGRAFRRSLEEVARMYSSGDVTVHVSHRCASMRVRVRKGVCMCSSGWLCMGRR